MMEPCIIPNIDHDVEFVVAAFGQTCFRCKLCGLWIDEADDALVG